MKISFRVSILPIKEITLHVKPVPMMCFMQGGGRWEGEGGGGRGGVVSNKRCLLTFLVNIYFP